MLEDFGISIIVNILTQSIPPFVILRLFGFDPTFYSRIVVIQFWFEFCDEFWFEFLVKFCVKFLVKFCVEFLVKFFVEFCDEFLSKSDHFRFQKLTVSKTANGTKPNHLRLPCCHNNPPPPPPTKLIPTQLINEACRH